MSKRIPIILGVALVCALVLGIQAVSSQVDTASVFIVLAGTSTGDGYKLEVGGWHIGGMFNGPAYHLNVTSSYEGTGTQCCCIKLPCVLKP
jgi:hypothetical protein